MADSRPLEKFLITDHRNFKQCIKRPLYGNMPDYRYRPKAEIAKSSLKQSFQLNPSRAT